MNIITKLEFQNRKKRIKAEQKPVKMLKLLKNE